MLDSHQFHSSDCWQNRAIDELCPHLDRAISTGTPSVVEPFPTALGQAELVSVAVRLCRESGVAAAVLVGPVAGGLTFVPFAAPPRPKRPAAEARYSRRRTNLSVAPLAEVTL